MTRLDAGSGREGLQRQDGVPPCFGNLSGVEGAIGRHGYDEDGTTIDVSYPMLTAAPGYRLPGRGTTSTSRFSVSGNPGAHGTLPRPRSRPGRAEWRVGIYSASPERARTDEGGGRVS
jgi:hypothetical protein